MRSRGRAAIGSAQRLRIIEHEVSLLHRMPVQLAGTADRCSRLRFASRRPRRIVQPMTTLATVVLGSPANDPLMDAIVRRIEAAGILVAAVALDLRIDDDAIHRARFRETLADVAGSPILGGFSLGARIAATLCAEVTPRALLAFGYPFHAANDCETCHGLPALCAVNVPTRIIQGTRDPHGTEAEIRTYALPDCIQMRWLPDGNHRYRPRQRSGFTHEDHIATAADCAISFVRSQ